MKPDEHFTERAQVEKLPGAQHSEPLSPLAAKIAQAHLPPQKVSSRRLRGMLLGSIVGLLLTLTSLSIREDQDVVGRNSTYVIESASVIAFGRMELIRHVRLPGEKGQPLQEAEVSRMFLIAAGIFTGSILGRLAGRVWNR